MFRDEPAPHLLPDLVTDDGTAQAVALALPPTVAPSAAPASITARQEGQGLFLSILIDGRLPPPDRELALELARAEVVRLLRQGTRQGGWRWNAAADEWRAVVPLTDNLSMLVPDFVPEEWIRAA